MHKLNFALFSILCLSLTTAFIGCETKPSVKNGASAGSGDSHGHDHGEHKHATTFAGALQEVDEFRVSIKDAFANKKPEDAHDALHEIGHVLESIEGLSTASTDEAKQSLKKAVDELMECFGELDKTLHGETGKTYEAVADRIDAAMSTLKGMVK